MAWLRRLSTLIDGCKAHNPRAGMPDIVNNLAAADRPVIASSVGSDQAKRAWLSSASRSTSTREQAPRREGAAGSQRSLRRFRLPVSAQCAERHCAHAEYPRNCLVAPCCVSVPYPATPRASFFVKLRATIWLARKYRHVVTWTRKLLRGGPGARCTGDGSPPCKTRRNGHETCRCGFLPRCRDMAFAS